MNLLDKYIEEVGSRLPRRNRRDLQAEIRSTIEDMLDDRSQAEGRPVDDVLIGEVLQEYGSPDKVAAGYRPARYLIGPRLYPIFAMVVKIVFTVLIVLAFVGAMIAFYGSDGSPAAMVDALTKYGVQLIGALLSAFGNIVIVFAIIERVKPDAKFDEEAEKWTPADLEAGEDADSAGRGEQIFAILFTVLGLVVFNLYPQVIGLGAIMDGKWVFISALSPAFFTYLPWINILGILNILLCLYMLRSGLWTTFSRVISLALDAAGIALAAAMLAGPSLVSFDPVRMEQLFGKSAANLQSIFTFLPVMVLTILIVVQVVEVVKDLIRLVKNTMSNKRYIPGQ